MLFVVVVEWVALLLRPSVWCSNSPIMGNANDPLAVGMGVKHLLSTSHAIQARIW